MTFDPYQELGLERGATTDEVKKAHRRRVKKTHPDAPGGGDREGFERTSRALAILKDPLRRARFDETGKDEKIPENKERADALGMISGFVGGALNAYLMALDQSQAHAHLADPRRRDLFKEFVVQMRNEIVQTEQVMKLGDQVREMIVDLAARFTSTDPEKPVERMLEERLRQHDGRNAEMHYGIKVRRLAIDIAASYNFRREVEQPTLMIGR